MASVVLDRTVRLVSLQFSFSNPDAIPVKVLRFKSLEHETTAASKERKTRATGILAIQPTEDCSLVVFLRDLLTDGYELVDSFYQPRIDQNNAARTYHMVRFLFARQEFVDLSDEFREVRGLLLQGLQEMCGAAMWRVQVFLNPHYEDGNEVAGQCSISINLGARKPLSQPDGKPVVQWEKDDEGKRIGDAPRPVRPRFHLRINGRSLDLAS